jgi:hypothetical protein
VGGRQYRAVPVPDVCSRYTCSPKHLQLPLSSSMLVRREDANSRMPIVMRPSGGWATGGPRWSRDADIVESTRE